MSLPYRPESFLIKLAILLVHLTNIGQAPLVSTYGTTPRPQMPLWLTCAWCILLTPLSLTPTWVLMLSRSTSYHDVIVLQRSTSDIFNAVQVKYRKGTYSVTIVTSVPWNMERVLHFWPCYELHSSVTSWNKSEMRQRRDAPPILAGYGGLNSHRLTLEADIFSGIPWDGKQNRYESRDWDGRGKNVIGSGRDRE